MDKQPDLQQLFGPIKTTELMKEFFRENPEAKWDAALEFLLQRFPQIMDGKVQYLIDGGTAVHILHPEREDPLDVDILVRSDEFKVKFVNARVIDAKSIKDWCTDHGIPYNEEMDEKILSLYTEVDFHGQKVLIAKPDFLALSKSIPWRGKPQQRQKETDDLRLLSVSQETLEQLKTTLGIQ